MKQRRIVPMSLSHLISRCVFVAVASSCVVAVAGPELPAGPGPRQAPRVQTPRAPRVQEAAVPERPRFQLPKLKHPGNHVTHRRPMGWGRHLNPYYGPTYYYPSTNNYRGLNPTYYPFFQDRRWPNYRAEPPAGPTGWFSFMRKPKPAPTVDEYDRFRRDGRYGERQWNR
jgi:hypothetical protein